MVYMTQDIAGISAEAIRKALCIIAATVTTTTTHPIPAKQQESDVYVCWLPIAWLWHFQELQMGIKVDISTLVPPVPSEKQKQEGWGTFVWPLFGMHRMLGECSVMWLYDVSATTKEQANK